jgi:hypothetical protein
MLKEAFSMMQSLVNDGREGFVHVAPCPLQEWPAAMDLSLICVRLEANVSEEAGSSS